MAGWMPRSAQAGGWQPRSAKPQTVGVSPGDLQGLDEETANRESPDMAALARQAAGFVEGGVGGALSPLYPLIAGAGALGSYALPGGGTLGERYDAEMAGLRGRSEKATQEAPVASVLGGLATAAAAPLDALPMVSRAVSGMGLGAKMAGGVADASMLAGLSAAGRGGDTQATVGAMTSPFTVGAGAAGPIVGGVAERYGPDMAYGLRGMAQNAASKAIGLPTSLARRFMANPELEKRATGALLDEGVVSPFASKATMNDRLGQALEKSGAEVGEAWNASKPYGFMNARTLADKVAQSNLAPLEANPAASQAELGAVKGYIDRLRSPEVAGTPPAGDEIFQGLRPPAAGTAASPGRTVRTTTPPVTGPAPKQAGDPLKGFMRPPDIHDQMVELGKRVKWSRANDPGSANALAGVRDTLKNAAYDKIAGAEAAGFPSALNRIKGAAEHHEALSQFKDAAEQAAIRESRIPWVGGLRDIGRDAMAATVGGGLGGAKGAAAMALLSRLGHRFGPGMEASGLNALSKTLSSGALQGPTLPPRLALTLEELKRQRDAMGPRLPSPEPP